MNQFFTPLRLASLFAFLAFSFSSYGQEKFKTSGRINLHLGLGFGINSLSNNQAGDKDAAALTGIFRLCADYGISPLFTAGLTIFNNGFATNKDSSESASIGGIGIYSHLFGREFPALRSNLFSALTLR